MVDTLTMADIQTMVDILIIIIIIVQVMVDTLTMVGIQVIIIIIVQIVRTMVGILIIIIIIDQITLIITAQIIPITIGHFNNNLDLDHQERMARTHQLRLEKIKSSHLKISKDCLILWTYYERFVRYRPGRRQKPK